MMNIYMLTLFIKVIYYQGDSIMVANYLFDTDALGEVSWKDIGISSFYALKKGEGYSNVLEYTDDIERYIEMSYV